MYKVSLKKIITGICFSALMVGIISGCKNKNENNEEEKPATFLCEMVNQDTPYCIVLSQNPTETESFAAQEMSRLTFSPKPGIVQRGNRPHPYGCH